MAALELKNVTYAYPNGHVANEKLNLKIESGEKVAIVGQNGAGKTTAAKLMNRLFIPTEGDVLINEINTKDKTTAQISSYVGYVFQNPDDQLFNNTVRAEIEYSLHYMKLPPEEVKHRLDRAVELTGIGEYLDMNPYDIPYSIRKFVTIAVVLAIDTPYMIFDEPTAGQDLIGLETLSKLIDTLISEGKSVVTITHDMEFVAENFSRVVAMANKQIIADDAARNVLWAEDILRKAKIKLPQIGELAKEVNIGEKVLFRNELIDALQEFEENKNN